MHANPEDILHVLESIDLFQNNQNPRDSILYSQHRACAGISFILHQIVSGRKLLSGNKHVLTLKIAA